MFDLDKWAEILETISKNKLRTFLTAFSVAWGIFMLIILLGAGRGLQNGVQSDFAGDNVNTVWITPGTTSKPFKGMQPNRKVEMKNEHYEYVAQNFEEVEFISGRFMRWSQKMSAGNRKGSFTMRGVHANQIELESYEVEEGRYINDRDVQQARKVVVIGRAVQEELFPDHKNPVNQYLQISGGLFNVVGVVNNESDGGENNVYVPISTTQKLFGNTDKLDRLIFSTGDTDFDRVESLIEELKTYFSSKMLFDPSDSRALYIRNQFEQYKLIQDIFWGINAFIWMIGIMTIVAGVIGVSNIMMITVKERTKEIGIRKALGATPLSILSLIMLEAIIITTVAGYIGLVSGVFLLEWLSGLGDFPMFKNPEVDLNIAVAATILLVVAGSLAGLFPAMKAAKVKPIVALRDE